MGMSWEEGSHPREDKALTLGFRCFCIIYIKKTVTHKTMHSVVSFGAENRKEKLQASGPNAACTIPKNKFTCVEATDAE